MTESIGARNAMTAGTAASSAEMAEAAAGPSCDTRAMWNWRTYEEAMSDLSGLPAGERLEALITVWSDEAELLSIEEMRKLFLYAWPDGRGAAAEDRDRLLSLLRFIAPVRDSETYLSGELAIFRAGEDAHGILWTLDETAATAEAGSGIRYSAKIGSEDVLAHLTDHGRNDVLVEPLSLGSIERAGHGRAHHLHRDG